MKGAKNMSKGFSGLFQRTLGTTYKNSHIKAESYSQRGIKIPKLIKATLSRLKKKGDYIAGSLEELSMTNVSIMSKETGIEFARITIGETAYLIRGDESGTTIPKRLLSKMKKSSGTLDFHSHPHNNDCIPSNADRNVMVLLERITGQRTSTIVTPNGKQVTFGKAGIVEVSTIPNRIDESYAKALLTLFGGAQND